MMRLFYIVLHAISITGSVVYPTYASYKTLSKRPTQEADLERWLMYWSVMGVVVGIETIAEWLIRWIPLYYYIKTIFLMYLALPQTQGATPLYNYRLLPLLEHYEPQIDASMARLRSRAYDFVRAKLQELWARVINAPPPSPSAPAPTMQDNPVAFATGFLKTWSPFLVAASGAMMQPQQQTQTTIEGGGLGGRSRSSSASSTSSFAPTDINLTSKAKPAIQRSGAVNVRNRTGRNAPRTSDVRVPIAKDDGESRATSRRSEGTSREERREAKPKPKVQVDELDSDEEEEENVNSPDGDAGPSKASSAYEKLKAD
ncbi:Receptor expression-enhancing protein 4 OS=Rattus norvegicus GN=Reep4 PE=2 SV=1 [Rhizoctonia solani AG-1 IB]|uniref:Protein YOP1 n=1 Tax=Thanatephorus cucumeris (strain AG1-IB / isolate 7/3/14) TaxID=1108050 RepID=A0A0B7FAG3_THACB|nr:Receptor expression-enhancing protein 4 OS=Rattus norvegicus GN=Reep4 PE=2 SV=1 [Rhizoctonia solani AG-1 IB]